VLISKFYYSLKIRLKIILLIGLWISFSMFSNAQIKTIESIVLDSQSGEPIPFVNVGFLNKSVGTVSDENGFFTMAYNQNRISENDTLQFSRIGYESTSYLIKSYLDIINNKEYITLNPYIDQLEEVLLFSGKRKKKTIGNFYDYKSEYSGYWKEKQALGGEIATKIRVKRKKSKLLNLTFKVLGSASDSILVRVNIYKEENKIPGKNILKKNIFHTITSKEGAEKIDLEPYNIVVSEDIIVSLELVKVYGKNIGFMIRGAGTGTSFIRYISQDIWKSYSIGMEYILETSYPLKK